MHPYFARVLPKSHERGRLISVAWPPVVCLDTRCPVGYVPDMCVQYGTLSQLANIKGGSPGPVTDTVCKCELPYASRRPSGKRRRTALSHPKVTFPRRPNADFEN